MGRRGVQITRLPEYKKAENPFYFSFKLAGGGGEGPNSLIVNTHLNFLELFLRQVNALLHKLFKQAECQIFLFTFKMPV
jgi:hypothetical protein